MSKQPDESTSLVYGFHAIEEAIEADKALEKIFLKRDLPREKINHILDYARQKEIPVSRVPQEKLNKMTNKRHQGVVAYISAIAYSSLDHIVSHSFDEGREPFILLLDRITDVRNFGAIARTAEGMGVDGLVIPAQNRALITEDAMKTSAGALHHIPVCREKLLSNAIEYLKNSGVQVVACTEKTDHYLHDLQLDGPIALIMGAEEKGIARENLSLADKQGALPLSGKVGSYNVSVSAAMAMYECARQRMGR